MSRALWLQETRKMRFEEAYGDWQAGRLKQEEAARLLGVCERTFRRYIDRYHEAGAEGLIDKRLAQVSHRRAPVDEVVGLVELYRDRYAGWNVRHFHTWYRRQHGGTRSYTWIKNTLQAAAAVPKAPARGKHRRRRERSPLPGMMLHQDGSTHEWVPGVKWDLIVTLDDATNEHTSMFFCEEEGTASTFHGIGQTIAAKGLFAMLYTDRGSHYFLTPEAGGKVSKSELTQVGRALAHLGIHHQAAYSPEARGRSERAFGTHQDRLPKELSLMGITDMATANRYLAEVYMPNHNREFMVPAQEAGNAFVPYIGSSLADILCEQHERTVGKDNCVTFAALKLQIPPDRYRHHYVKAKVRVHRYVDGTLAIFHGPRRLADYSPTGEPITEDLRQAA